MANLVRTFDSAVAIAKIVTFTITNSSSTTGSTEFAEYACKFSSYWYIPKQITNVEIYTRIYLRKVKG